MKLDASREFTVLRKVVENVLTSASLVDDMEVVVDLGYELVHLACEVRSKLHGAHLAALDEKTSVHAETLLDMSGRANV